MSAESGSVLPLCTAVTPPVPGVVGPAGGDVTVVAVLVPHHWQDLKDVGTPSPGLLLPYLCHSPLGASQAAPWGS